MPSPCSANLVWPLSSRSNRLSGCCNELKNRGLEDVLIAVIDGLRAFPEATEVVYPQMRVQVQTCIVHLIRNSLSPASWQGRKELAAT